MARQDLFDTARQPDAIRTCVFACVRDPQGAVLVHERRNGTWSLPGGVLEPGESFEDCARREVAEETGVQVDHIAVQGVVTDPQHLILLDDDPHAYQQVAVLVTATPVGGSLTPSSESPTVLFADEATLGTLPLDQAQAGYLTRLIASNADA